MREIEEKQHAIEIETKGLLGTVIKINGVEVQNLVRKFTLVQNAGSFPQLILEMKGSDIAIGGSALISVRDKDVDEEDFATKILKGFQEQSQKVDM
ncbi:MAG: hypothetical protein R3Y54_14225 [Eubacteriales bacterium]